MYAVCSILQSGHRARFPVSHPTNPFYCRMVLFYICLHWHDLSYIVQWACSAWSTFDILHRHVIRTHQTNRRQPVELYIHLWMPAIVSVCEWLVYTSYGSHLLLETLHVRICGELKAQGKPDTNNNLPASRIIREAMHNYGCVVWTIDSFNILIW